MVSHGIGLFSPRLEAKKSSKLDRLSPPSGLFRVSRADRAHFRHHVGHEALSALARDHGHHKHHVHLTTLEFSLEKELKSEIRVVWAVFRWKSGAKMAKRAWKQTFAAIHVP